MHGLGLGNQYIFAYLPIITPLSVHNLGLGNTDFQPYVPHTSERQDLDTRFKK